MNQNIRTTDAVTFATVNTGQGANELYAMDQNVRTSDNVQFANVTATGFVRATNGFIASDNVRIFAPQGASYVTSASSVTGAWKIKLPVSKNNSSTMMRMTVKIYQYNTGKSHTFYIGGYNYSGGNWYNIFATNITDTGDNYTVRFGYDGSSDCIWIGETGSSWSYPQVFVTDAQFGYSGYDTNWGTGWSINPVTSFDTVEQTRTAALTLNSTLHPYAANMDQYVRTYDTVTFNNINVTNNIESVGGDIKFTGSDSYIWMPNNNSYSTGFYDPVSGLVPIRIDGPSDGIYIGNNMWLSYNVANNNNYNENIRLFAANNGVSVIGFRAGANTSGGQPDNSILGYSDRLEIRQGSQWQLRSYANYVEAYGDFRAPIFRDTADPSNKYVDPAGTSQMNFIRLYDSESMQLYGIRGRFTNEYIHLYNKVGIGHPGGWGAGEGNTPVYGLSTYGQMNIGYGYTDNSNLTGALNINGSTFNAANDATLYITATNNNDWLLRLNAANGSKTEYGMYVGIPSGAGYAYAVLRDNNTWVYRVSGQGYIYTNYIEDITNSAYRIDFESTSRLNALQVNKTYQNEQYIDVPGTFNASSRRWVRFSISRFNAGGSPVRISISRSISDNGSNPYGGCTAEFVINSREWHSGQENMWYFYTEHGSYNANQNPYAYYIYQAGPRDLAGGGYWFYMLLLDGVRYRMSVSADMNFNSDGIGGIEYSVGDPGGVPRIPLGSGVIGNNSTYNQITATNGMFGIMYDYDDRGFYVDPNSTTNIRYLKVNTTGTSSGTRALTIKQDGQGEINFGSYPASWTSALQIQNNNNTDYLWMSPLDDGYAGRIVMVGDNLDIYPQNSYSATFLPGEIRSTLLRDPSSTSYLVRPADTSFMARIELQQNPVGTAYANSSNAPTYYFGQQRGDNDAWKIYGESPGGSNTGNLILQSEDDYDANESIRFRFKRTYPGYQTNDILVAYYNYAQFNGELRAPSFVDSDNPAFFCDPNGRSRLSSMDYGNGSYYLAGGSWGYRHNTPYGYIEFGPANSSHAHIYTDRSNFYFNVDEMYQNGRRLLAENIWINSKYFGSDGNIYATRYRSANDGGYYIEPLGYSYIGRDNGPVLEINKYGSAPGNNTALLVRNQHGNHSWGIVAEFRVDGSSGSDRPSILFSSGFSSWTWSVGYGYADDNFRINDRHGWRNGSWGNTRLLIDTGSTTYIYGSFQADILYDRNSTGYYLGSGNGDSSVAAISTNNTYIRPGYMLYSDMGGWTGEYNKIQWHSSHLYFQQRSGGYHIMRRTDGNNTHYFAEDGNIWTSYWGWFTNIINQNVRTDASPTFYDLYVNGWFRNNTSGHGLYNQSRGMHWYSNNGYWKSAGGGYAYGGIVMYNNYESDLRGYAGYWDGSGFGLLNSSGNWQVRIEYGNAHMELYRITYGNDARFNIYYDRDTTYYFDGNGNSQWQGLTDYGRMRTGLTGKGGSNYRRNDYTGDSNHWTGVMGWGTQDLNTVQGWGAGFTDTWSNPGNQPPGTSHWLGMQTYHYCYSGYGYGWQIEGGPVDRLYFRNSWPYNSGWKAMVDSNNRGEYCIPTYDYNHYSRVYFTYNRGYYATQTDSAMCQPYSTGNNGAFMSFHKGGYYAINLGLDGDNVVRWGGWSSRWQRYYLNDDTLGTPYILRSNFDNYGSGGIWVSDDGDLVDLNDGYLALRASYGLRIHSGNRGGGPNINLRYDGVIIASNNIIAYGSPSDRRLKDNVTPLENSLDKVMKMRGVEFDWREGTDEYETTGLRHDIGFIAQEIEDIVPDLVRPGEDGYLAVRDRGIPALLLEAIKELKGELDEARTKIKILEEKLGL